MNMGNKSELAIWKCDYFQIPFRCGAVEKLMSIQNAQPRTCSSTMCLESHTKYHAELSQPVPNPLQPFPKGAWRASAAGLGWHTNPSVAALGAGQPHPKIHSCTSSAGRSNQPPEPATPPGGHPNFTCWDVSLPPSFFTNCSHLRIEKFHSTGHKVSI